MMKRKRIQFLMAAILLAAFCCMTGLNAQTSTVFFQADLSETNVEDPATVGVRGSVAPLSWTETLPMKDEGDGIYSIKVEFENFKPGDEVLYKYVHSDLVWENEELGGIGNRAVYLYEGKLKLSVDKWNHLDKYTSTSLLEVANGGDFWNWIYIIGSKKKDGLTPEEIGMKFVAFWGSVSWIEVPQVMMDMDKVEQARHGNGYFEIIENIEGKVVYKAKKTWLNFFGEEDHVENVSRDDMTRVFKAINKSIALARGWQYTWEDEEGDLFKVTIEK